MKKIITYLIIGAALLLSGTGILLFGGPEHKGKGIVMTLPGLFLSAAYGITFLQVRKQYLKKEGTEDLLDQE